MLDLNNLYWEEKQNIDLIKSTAQQVWGSNVQFGEIKVINSPYPEFEWPIYLYGKAEVGIYYDRSALDIGIKQNGKYELLGKFTNQNVLRGMKAMQPENLLHNFQVLDNVVKKII